MKRFIKNFFEVTTMLLPVLISVYLIINDIYSVWILLFVHIPNITLVLLTIAVLNYMYYTKVRRRESKYVRIKKNNTTTMTALINIWIFVYIPIFNFILFIYFINSFEETFNKNYKLIKKEEIE